MVSAARKADLLAHDAAIELFATTQILIRCSPMRETAVTAITTVTLSVQPMPRNMEGLVNGKIVAKCREHFNDIESYVGFGTSSFNFGRINGRIRLLLRQRLAQNVGK